MRYQISGKQIDIGEALTQHVQNELGETVGKYSQRPTDAIVTFSKKAHMLVCDSLVHLSTGLTVQAKGEAPEIYAAFEAARERMDKQLRRYKRRIKDRHAETSHAMRAEEAAYTVFVEPDEAVEEVTIDAPVVIAETRVDVPEATVSDAVMMLDLRNTNALLFKNAGTGKHNMVYRRGDGSIGWVEPS